MAPKGSSAEPLPTAVMEFLSADERIERCPPDVAYAFTVIDRVLVEEVEDALHAAAQGRWVKANTYSHDGARKSVEAWLLSAGWRVRAAPGAHAAAVEIVARWLGDTDNPGPRIARTFAAARKARHDDEYPSPAAPERTVNELRALALDNARLINEVRTKFGLDALERIVPTDDVLDARPERRPDSGFSSGRTV
jgi:hypothetical protein